MASLSNINGLFDVHSTGAILFSTSHGTSGQILKSNGNAAPTWIPQSDIVGDYLPLSGGTLTGATATASGISFTVGGTLTGTTATFSANVGIGVAAHGTASLNITSTDQHIRLNNGSELGIINLDADGKLDLWAHGTDETISFRTGTGSGIVTMSVVGGKVGIGTTSPDAKLQVEGGDIWMNKNNAASNYYLRLNKKEGRDGGILWYRDSALDFQHVNSNSNGNLSWYSYGTSSTVMTLQKSTGNLGIGTTNPSEKLDVVGNIYVEDGQTTGLGVILQNGDRPMITRRWDAFTSGSYTGIGRWGLFMEVATTFLASPGTDYTNGLVSLGGYTASGTPQYNLTVNNYTRRVGIGTTSPSTKLHVSHTARIDDAYGLALIENTSTGSGSDANSALNIKSKYGTSQFMQWENQGLRIGSRIVANGAPGDVYFTAGSDNVKMVMKAGGNVGIGTSSPGEKLEVNGNIKAKDVTGLLYSNVTSFSGTVLVDCFEYNSNGLWEYTIRLNPNTAGSGAYIDYYYGKVGVGIGWNGSAVTQYLWVQQDQTPPRSLYPSGGGNFGITFNMLYNGSVYTSLPLGTTWYLRLQGLSTSSNGEIIFRRLA